MLDKLCKDNVICCDDNCKRCANLIYQKYIEQKEKIERLENHNNQLIETVDNLVYECDCAKQEAYKEIVESLKETFENLEYSAKTKRKTVKVEELQEQMDWVLHTVVIETIDNILKEKVGEHND